MTDGARVLIVDGNAGCAAFAADVLGREGYRVEVVCSAAEALNKLRSEPFELALLDLGTANDDGGRVIEQLRGERKDLAIVTMATFGSGETAVLSARAGAYDYLSKPLEAASLLVRIRNAIERRARILEKEKLQEAVDEILRRKPVR